MRELLSNNSLFAGQMYEDQSLALRACDLIFFPTDLQTVNYNSAIHCYTCTCTFIVFLILNSWETDLQKSIDFLLNPFFVFRNDLYVNSHVVIQK